MFLEKLKEFPKNKTLIISTVITFIPFILIMIFVFVINEFLLESNTGYGVLDLELAWTPERVDEIFNAWGPAEMERQTMITYIDYIFIICYVLLSAELILLVSRKLEGEVQKIGFYSILDPLIAGIFDAIENLFLIIMLNSKSSIPSIFPFLASLCATFKIIFLLITMAFFYISLIFLIIRINRIVSLYLVLIISGILITLLWSFWSLFLGFLFGTAYFVLMFVMIRNIKK